jgi:hypothetical protein
MINLSLLKILFKLDYRDREKSSKKKLIGLLSSYVFANSMLSISYFVAFDKYSFAFLTFTMNLFLISFLILNEFQELVFAKGYIDVLKSLPLKENEIFLGKFISVFLYASLVLVAAIIPQTVFFYFIEKNLLVTVSYFFSNYVFVLTAICLILFLFCLVLQKLESKAYSVIYFVQFFFFLYIMYSSNLSARIRGGEKMSIFEFPATNYFPQKYFAFAVDNAVLFSVCLLFSLFVIILFILYAGKNYFALVEISGRIEKKKKSRKLFASFGNAGKFFDRIFLKNPTQKASYNLMKNMFINSRIIKSRFVYLIIIPVLMSVIALMGKADKGLTINLPFKLPFAFNEIPIINPSVLFGILLCFRMMVALTKIGEDENSAVDWLYAALPVTKTKNLLVGVEKFLYAWFIIPSGLIAYSLLLLKLNPLTVAVNFVFLFSALMMINSVFLLFDKKLPFSLSSTNYNSSRRLVEVLYNIILSVILFLVQFFVFQNVIFVSVTIALFFILSFLIYRN